LGVKETGNGHREEGMDGVRFFGMEDHLRGLWRRIAARKSDNYEK
jgi:hypothetical protein